jgi:fructose-bisphosphate aldolase class 1
MAIMGNDKMMAQISSKAGFIAALDQSGGSTPGALRLYGIPDSAYSGDTEMFRLMHEMRVRIMTAPAFTGAKIIATILFEGTMDGLTQGKPVPSFLWDERGVVPFLKVDKGLEAENDGVSLMRPIAGLDALLDRAAKLGIFGTKMRSVINLPSRNGIAAIVAQQFDVAAQISRHGLMPILEPEVLIKSPDKAGAEAILLAELTKQLDAFRILYELSDDLHPQPARHLHDAACRGHFLCELGLHGNRRSRLATQLRHLGMGLRRMLLGRRHVGLKAHRIGFADAQVGIRIDHVERG